VSDEEACCPVAIEIATQETGCECPAAGFCSRHKCTKVEHWHKLCQTNSEYFDLYERGNGPGQQTSRPVMSSFQRVRKLAMAVYRFVRSGCDFAGRKECRERLKICDSCEKRDGNVCTACTCNLLLKAKMRSESCPLGKWPHQITNP
jgi:hypothetical protein